MYKCLISLNTYTVQTQQGQILYVGSVRGSFMPGKSNELTLRQVCAHTATTCYNSSCCAKKQPFLSEMAREEGRKKHSVPFKGKLDDLD